MFLPTALYNAKKTIRDFMVQWKHTLFFIVLALDAKCTVDYVPTDACNSNLQYFYLRLILVVCAYFNEFCGLQCYSVLYFIHMFSGASAMYVFCFTLFGDNYALRQSWYPLTYLLVFHIGYGVILHLFLFPHPPPAPLDESKFTESELKEKLEEEELKKVSKVELAMKLFKKMKPAIKQFMAVWLFIPFAAYSSSYFEICVGEIFDLVRDIENVDRSEIYQRMFYIFMIGGMVKPILNWVRDYYQMSGCATTIIQSRSFTLASILKQDFGFFDVKSSGALNTILTSNVDRMAYHLFWNFRWVVEISVRIIVILYFCFSMNTRLAALSASFLPIIIFIGLYFGDIMFHADEKHSELNKECNRIGLQALQNIRTVRAFHCEEREYEEYLSKLNDLQNKEKEKSFLHSNFWAFFVLFPEGSRALVLYWGMHLIELGEISGGELVSFMLLQNRLCHCCGHLAHVWRSCMEGLAKGASVFQMLERQPAFTFSNKCTTIENMKGTIQFSNVKFCYPKYPEKVVFDGLDLLIEPGQVVALIGPSGKGKSTILQLIQFFYKQEAGSITLDGVPIEELAPQFLRTAVVAVEQDPTLFDRSIRDNICYGLDDVTDAQLAAACEMANCTEFIMEFPKKYDTVVGERGVTLSGGQKQRICIARALVRSPKILLLDEATSSLDAESEAKVHAAIESIMNHYTVVVVAHRLSTIKNADKICVVQDQRITETGTHEELLAQRGRYFQLINKQVHGGKTEKQEHSDDENNFDVFDESHMTTVGDIVCSKEEMVALKNEVANVTKTVEKKKKSLVIPKMTPKKSTDSAA